MSSILTNAFDAMVTKMGVLFPQHTRLANPYKVDMNAEPFLKKGFGVMIGAGSENRTTQSAVCIKRRMSVVQTRNFISVDSRPDSAATAEKQLIDDQLALLNSIEKDATLGGVVMQIGYDSDRGIESIFSNEKQFLKVETQFSVLYIENLT